jgi:hypothetical protein
MAKTRVVVNFYLDAMFDLNLGMVRVLGSVVMVPPRQQRGSTGQATSLQNFDPETEPRTTRNRPVARKPHRTEERKQRHEIVSSR